MVGARCAGSPLAMLLARMGHHVLVVDRAQFPSETLSTHFIQPPGMARLRRWGLEDRIAESGAPAMTQGVFAFGETEMLAPEGMFPTTFAPRRGVLDAMLVDAAREAGAEIREGIYVEDLVREDGRVTGIVARDSDGQNVTELAKIVIGADGRNSTIAKLAEAPFIDFTDSLCCGYYGYWRGEFSGRAEFRLHDDRCLITFPTNGSQVVIAIWSLDRFKEIRKSPAENVINAYSDVPHMAEALKQAELTEKVAGTADIPNFVRKAWGPGWALVGDALYHKDPTPADGMNDALRSSEVLATSIDNWLSGSQSMDEALDDYARECYESASKSLPSTIRLSRIENPMEDRASAFLELGTWRGEEFTAISEGALP